MSNTWESDLANLLAELSAAQTEMLAVLAEKRAALVAADMTSMQAVQAREQSLVERLQHSYERRCQLLSLAAEQGLPNDSIVSLAAALPGSERQQLARQADEATRRARTLQQHNLTNWVLAQRTLIYLSQLLEIIATGGRLRPTYGKNDSADKHGSLVDQAA